MRTLSLLLVSGSLLLLSRPAPAQPGDALRDAVQKAVATHPDVTARFNAFRAATEEIGVTEGGFYPRVDLSADVVSNKDRITSRIQPDNAFGQRGVALSVSQLLWDGLITRNEVDRLGHARMTRYFEFLDTSEQTALEAVRAYQDVLRYRQMVRLAEDSYVQHKYAYEQILARVKAGVGRGVDLEQAGARLALADSNRITEIANLHDVSERYRRLVGEAPPELMPQASGLERGLPASQAQIIEQAGMRSATVAAAVENLRAAQFQAKAREGGFQPKVEARVRTGEGHNFDGIQDQKRDTSAGVYLSWNLFNGGADQARVRQNAHLVSQAADQRDKACRDARQTAAIAYNDVGKLTEQMLYLDRNVLAIEKARDAYRQQFDIGQRSLLDLLNAENELYTARRAYANAEFDLGIARARTQAGMGTLVATLGLTRLGAGTELPDVQSWQAGDDAAARCPIVASAIVATSREELDARARQMVSPIGSAVPRPAAAPASAPTPAPAPAPAAPARPISGAAAPAPVQPVAITARQRLHDWVHAWTSKDVERYIGFYAQDFQPGTGSRSQWLALRRRLVTRDGPIDVRIRNVQTRAVSADTVETRFSQRYASQDFNARTQKTLTWRREGDQWLIVGEINR
ncbi:MAG TPA: TolC family outer membrane protein [Burkholderiaceae bacterium]|nr:TolC family outer membrane protein [Burkholderiaceae bacterium]